MSGVEQKKILKVHSNSTLMPAYEHNRSFSPRRVAHHGQQNKEKPYLLRKPKNNAFVGGIETFFAEIDAIFGKKGKKSFKSINNSYLKKKIAPLYAEDLNEELDLWFLRAQAVLESAKETFIEIYTSYRRKILNFGLWQGVLFNQDANVSPNDNIQALTAEIEKIFGGRLRRFGARVHLHKVLTQQSNVSANDLRNELERLLKKDKTQAINKEVA